METKTKIVFITSRKAIIMIATMTFLLLLTTTPMGGYSALCAKPDKSTTYFTGYADGQSDFHSGRPQNQNITSDSSHYNADYKQGYKDGWNDAQYNVNVVQSSIC